MTQLPTPPGGSQGNMGDMSVVHKQAVEVEDDLIQHIWQLFHDQCEEFNYDEQWKKGAFDFAKWAKAYLEMHRPVRTFAADNNVGVVLSNNDQVLVSPKAADVKGTMAETPLGKEQRQGVPDVYANQGAIPISGGAQKQQGQIDYNMDTQRNFERKGGQGDDKTLPQKEENLAQKHQYGRKL